MSSIRWSALVVSLLAPLACAPHYDVGDAEKSSEEGGMGGGATGGSSTTGGSGGASSGGTGTTGGSGNASSGGSGTTGGSGGASATGGTGTSGGSGAIGGSDATGGTGGSSGEGSGGFSGVGAAGAPVSPDCGLAVEYEYTNLVSPEEAWARVSRFLFGEVRDPPSPLPDVTTPDWVVGVLREALEQSRQTSAAGRAALTPFMRRFLETKEQATTGDTPPERWARLVTAEGSRFGILFEGDAESEPPFGLFGTVAASYDGLSQRGSFLSSKLYCQAVGAPPAGTDEPLVVPPTQTRREATLAATASPVCIGCHHVVDALAYPLEVLTPGTLEYRTTENGLPIDTSGSYDTAQNHVVEFADLASLASEVSVSCDAARCFAAQLFEHATLEADIPSYVPAELERVLYQFAAPDSPAEDRFYFQALLEAIVSSPSFLH